MVNYQFKKPKKVLVRKFLKEYDQYVKECDYKHSSFNYEEYLQHHIAAYSITLDDAALKGKLYYAEHIHKLDTCVRLYNDLKGELKKNEK